MHLIILPNTLFYDVPKLNPEKVTIWEHPQYFTKYKYNKKRLMLHRASMKYFEDYLKSKKISTNYIEFNKKFSSPKDNCHYDCIDFSLPGKTIESPNFLMTFDLIDTYRKKTDKFFFSPFYMWLKKELNILPNQKSTDSQNRKTVPKGMKIPGTPRVGSSDNKYISEAKQYVEKNFRGNYGNTDDFNYPISRSVAKRWLSHFILQKLSKFGDYQDFTLQSNDTMFHSLLSSSINIGLLNPNEVIKSILRARKGKGMNSVEGFIRQLFWREYNRYCYIFRKDWLYRGKSLKNYFGNSARLTKSWYDGTTGIDPVDDAIKDAFETGYLHHIRRLMIVGNFMNLSGIDPRQGFRWFMEFSCDSYEWVMYQNVFDMAFFASGETMRKPYVSSSNYILKMSDYKRGEWADKWDELYQKFMKKNLKKLWKYRYHFPGLKKIKGSFEMNEIDEMDGILGGKEQNGESSDYSDYSKDTAIFIFRRDFRLVDNTGFNWAMNNCKKVIPVFIFTPEQADSKRNKYFSDNSFAFMIECLRDLDGHLRKSGSKLHSFYGDNVKVVSQLIREIGADKCVVVENVDYTPYAEKRSKDIKRLCKSKKVEYITTEDYLLASVGTFLKPNKEPYTIYTPFFNKVMANKKEICRPDKSRAKNLGKIGGLSTSVTLKEMHGKFVEKSEESDRVVQGGRKSALLALVRAKGQKKYNKTRNTLALPTTRLSAYIKFGCISVREVFYYFLGNLGRANQLLNQIVWREFYFYITYYFPEVLKGKNFNPQRDGIKWVSSAKQFQAWCDGETGYPVVDAGMRELNETGYMHNRARLITSNFLNRILGQNWRRGEQYFANKLTDYDPAVNNGNWQWIASVGVDPKPFNQRLFNPWIQSEKFDPDASYIKKWVPELKNVPAKHIHRWDKYCEEYEKEEGDYPDPIIDYKTARERSIRQYKLK